MIHEKPYERLEYEDSVIEVVNAMQEPDGQGIDRLNARLLVERMQSDQLETDESMDNQTVHSLDMDCAMTRVP